MKNINPRKIWSAIFIIILCIIFIGSYIYQPVAQSRNVKAEVLLATVTQTLATDLPPLPIAENEPDVTAGIILVGSLLVLVIIFGTLHATRGQGKPR